jgi:hypothetical protein
MKAIYTQRFHDKFVYSRIILKDKHCPLYIKNMVRYLRQIHKMDHVILFKIMVDREKVHNIL